MNCKTGDVAVVIRSRNPSSLGAIVEVVRPFDGGRCGTAPMWWVRTAGRSLRAVGSFSGEIVHCREGAIEDRHLRPVSGLEERWTRDQEVAA